MWYAGRATDKKSDLINAVRVGPRDVYARAESPAIKICPQITSYPPEDVTAEWTSFKIGRGLDMRAT